MSDFDESTLASLVYESRPITYGIVQPGPDISPDGIPLIRGKDYSSGKVSTEGLYHVLAAIDQPYSRSKVLEGDLLFSIVGYVGLTAQVPPELTGANITQTTARLSIDPNKADSSYVFHYLSSPHYRPNITRYEKGSAQPGLNLSDVQKLKIKHPKLPQQHRIATILSTMDEMIEATEKLVEKHQQIKAGLMHDLFTRGLWTRPELARGDHKGTPAEATAQEGQLRPTPQEAPGLYQDSPMGLIPKTWSFASISDLGVVKGGKRLPAGTPFSETPTQFPYLRVTDMVDGWIDDSSLEFVDPHIEPLISNYKIFKNDIYVTIAGTLGQFGRIPPHLDGAQLTENAARITEIDQKRVCLDFMCAFLRSNLMAPQKFKAYGLGAGVPKLALYQIERFILPLPPIEEQKTAETVLASAQNDIRSNLTHLAKLRQQKQGLMHDLLTGRVRVDGPAEF